MADTTARRRGELLRGVFHILLDAPDGLPAKSVLAQLDTLLPPTEFERSDYPERPGVRRYERRVRFSTIKVVKAGWLVKEKGTWSLTDQGRDAYERYLDPVEFDRETTRLYRQWKKDQQQDDERFAQTETDDDGSTSTVAIEEAEENAWREIEDYLSSMPPYDFQQLVAALLNAMGYHVAWIAPPGKDGGIDIVAHTDPLGTRVPRIKVQVKRRQDKVTVDGMRSFMAVLGEHDVGIFVSTGGFTKDAESEARLQEKRHLTLVDLKRLFDLWVEYYDRIDAAEKTRLPLKPIHYLAADD